MKKQAEISRRNFMNTVASGAVGSMALAAGPLMAMEVLKSPERVNAYGDEWFKKIKGSHRVVFDGSTPHEGFPVLWSHVFYMTNEGSGVAQDDMTAVCVLRHSAIPFALADNAWYQYELGKHFEITDKLTGKPALRNVVYEPKDGDFPVPGVPGIKKLQEKGAMFCVCDLALKVYSGMVAQKLGMDGEVAYADWKMAVLPEIEVVPSGVWALTRAQKEDCAYIFAGN